MTRSQKRNLLITIILIAAFLGVLITYWCIIGFNPFLWIKDNANYFILAAVLILCAGLMILGYWLTHRRRL